MSTTVQIDESGERTGQDLPADAATLAGWITKDDATESGGRRSEGTLSEPPAGPLSIVVSPATAGTSRGGSVAQATMQEARPVRLVEVVEGAILSFHRRNGEALEVAIQPDPETEIRLHLSLRDGFAEVRAELRRGDAALFAPHWQELQDRLAHQGVRLSAWDAGTGGSGPNGSGNGQGGAFASPEHSDESWLDELHPRAAGPSETILTSRSSRNHGWETWA